MFELCLCASQDLEKAAKVSHDLEKQVQQLQKQCADTEAAATSKEVCTYQLSWLMGCVARIAAAKATAPTTTAALHVQQSCHLHDRCLQPPPVCVGLQASLQEVTKKLQDLTDARAHDRKQVGVLT